MKTYTQLTSTCSALLLCVGLGFIIFGSAFSSVLHTPAANSLSKPLYDTAGMVLVRGGTFTMGSTVFPNEMPIHEVELSSFYIDRYEVTVKQYREYCEATGTEMPKEPTWGWQDNHPMVNVTWDDAKKYAEYKGKRLPTEAEWEFAARGGTSSQNFTYSGGNYPEIVGWYEKNSVETVQPVGLKRPNELGIYDMSGNVWEWCSDYYGRYEDYKQKNPQGVPHGLNRVIRGGSWFGNKGNLRVANRYYNPQGYGSNIIGFRLVMNAE